MTLHDALVLDHESEATVEPIPFGQCGECGGSIHLAEIDRSVKAEGQRWHYACRLEVLSLREYYDSLGS